MDLRPGFVPIADVKPAFNVGALLDIPQGFYEIGKYGESILNGGCPPVVAVVGRGNSYKSTILHFIMLTAMSRIPNSYSSTYDTEVNIHVSRLKTFVSNIRETFGEDIIQTGRWNITDKTLYTGNAWYDSLKEYLELKAKNAKNIMVETPFVNKGNLLKIIQPTFSQVDSISEFTTDADQKMIEENELGESGANTLFMKQGLIRHRLMMEMPALMGRSGNYMLMTAHMGKEIQMDPRAPAAKKLQYLKNNDKIKGVSDKFLFLTNICWYAYNATALNNQTTKGPEYPKDPKYDYPGDTDLNEVTVQILRNKGGPSGLPLTIVISQSEGVLPSLTEFHFIKTWDRFGLEGSNTNYNHVMLPDVSLSRTKVRMKLDENPRLRRAVNISSEMLQMQLLWKSLDRKYCITPKELYDSLKAKGYNWDTLLDTRGWWTVDNDKHPIPFLSTMDLLRMHTGEYHPYWMEPLKK